MCVKCKRLLKPQSPPPLTHGLLQGHTCKSSTKSHQLETNYLNIQVLWRKSHSNHHRNSQRIKKNIFYKIFWFFRVGEMAWCLKALAALPEDPRSYHPIRSLTIAWAYSSGRSNTLLCPPQGLTHVRDTPTHKQDFVLKNMFLVLALSSSRLLWKAFCWESLVSKPKPLSPMFTGGNKLHQKRKHSAGEWFKVKGTSCSSRGSG